MPRNGSGVMVKPAGTTAVTETTIDSAKFNEVIDDIIADLNTARPLTSGGTGAVSASAARDSLGVDYKAIYATKTGNYTAVGDDNNAVHRYTSDATVTLTAAATLGAHWHHTVRTAGATVTIDPNSSETIDGAETLVVPPYSSAKIFCTGTDFFTEIRLPTWEKIADRTITAQSSEPFIDLSAYRKLKLSGYLSVSTSTIISLQTSTDNGSNYASGSSDYFYLATVARGTTPESTYNSGSGAPIILNLDSGSGNGAAFSVEIENFNKALPARFRSSSDGFYLSTMSDVTINSHRASTTARDAFRVLVGAGTMTGTLTLEGIRG